MKENTEETLTILMAILIAAFFMGTVFILLL